MATVDLTKQAPRSPYEKLGGIAFLPRTIDKMRAHIAGTAGEYVAKAGYSQQLYDLFGVTADEFEDIVQNNESDEQVLKVLLDRRPLSKEEIEEWNHRSETRTPQDEAGWTRHWKQLADAGFGDRKDVRTMFDRLDLDDGRDVPVKG